MTRMVTTVLLQSSTLDATRAPKEPQIPFMQKILKTAKIQHHFWYIDRFVDFPVVVQHQVPPSKTLQRRQTSLATSILIDKLESSRRLVPTKQEIRSPVERTQGVPAKELQVQRKRRWNFRASSPENSGSEVHSQIVVDLTVLHHERAARKRRVKSSV